MAYKRVKPFHTIKFLAVEGGMHGGMMWRPKVWAYKKDPTPKHPRRFVRWFSRPNREEVERELNKRCRWAEE